MGAALFDVDGTLLEGPSAEVLFAAYLARRFRIGLRQLATAALFIPRWGTCYGRHVFKKNKAYLAGLAVDEVTELADAFVASELEARLRPALVARIAAHRDAGDHVMLLTGTPEFIAGPIARRIGAERWSATHCARHNGAFTAEPPQAHPFFREKVTRSLELCAEIGCELADCTAYGNSAYDVPLLSRVARPVAVAPERRLARLAHENGWEILS